MNQTPMSIVPVQKFEFETDSFDAMRAILPPVARSAFGDRSPYRMRLCSKQETMLNKIEYSFERQPSVFGVGTDRWLLLEAERMFSGATVLKQVGTAESLEKAAAAAIERREHNHPPQETQLCVVLLEPAGYANKDSVEYSHHKSVEELCSQALLSLQFAYMTRQTEFNQRCGTGYHAGFDHSDGDVVPGLFLQHRFNGGDSLLLLGLTHIYYGK